MTPPQIVHELLEDTTWVRALISEASVHRPRRGKKWMASFTGIHGQQWRSTGTDDLTLALARAAEFEATARAERQASPKKWRASRLRQTVGRRDRGLTQGEIALLLGLAERSVRAIERRALRKLAQHPELRELWRQYLAGELTEAQQPLSAPELTALWGLTRSQAERAALQKALARVQSQPGESGPGGGTSPRH